MGISGTVGLVDLLAKAAYKNTDNQPKVESNAMQDAVSFQNMVKADQNTVKANFNKFAKMSPQEISSAIKSFQNSSVGIANNMTNNVALSGITQSIVGSLKTPLGKSEDKIRKSLINEASLLDIVTSSNEAKNVVTMMAEFKKGFFDALEKTLNLQV